jgi:predicted nucleotidyltransferase
MTQQLNNYIQTINKIREEVSKKGKLLFLCRTNNNNIHGFHDNVDKFGITLDGVYLSHSNNLLGLKTVKDVIDFEIGSYRPALFLELRHFINLCLKMNFGVLQILTVEPLETTKEFEAFKNIFDFRTKKGIYTSYKEQFLKQVDNWGENRTVQDYLRVTTPLFCGIHCLENEGQLMPNIRILAPYFPKFIILQELDVAIKDDYEEDFLSKEVKGAQDFKYLSERLDKAYKDSTLPELPGVDDFNKLHNFLVKTRKNYL